MLVLAEVEFTFFSVAVFWICAEYRVGKVEMFLLLVSRTNRANDFPAVSAGDETGGALRVRRRHSQDR